MQNGIVIKGIEYELVLDNNSKYGCGDCALQDLCYKKDEALCDIVIMGGTCHFEIKK